MISESDRQSNGDDNDTDDGPSLDSKIEKTDDVNRRRRKVNVTIAIDDSIINEIRKEANESGQSLNTRINAILRKHTNFYRMVEVNGGVILHPKLAQFMVDEIDEAKFTDIYKKIGNYSIESLFVTKGIPITFENFCKFYFEELAVYAGAIKSVSRLIDVDGKTYLYFIHNYDWKWSRILSAVFSSHIEDLLHYHTISKPFQNGMTIKILEKDPI